MKMTIPRIEMKVFDHLVDPLLPFTKGMVFEGHMVEMRPNLTKKTRSAIVE